MSKTRKPTVLETAAKLRVTIFDTSKYIQLTPLSELERNAAPKPIPADDREEVARAIKHCFDTGKTGFDQITDAAISTLVSLGWRKG